MERKIGNIFGFSGGNYAGNVYDKDHLSPTLKTMKGGLSQPMIVEANSIHMIRTEEGKALRKQYESHEIKHGFNEHRKPELRSDGCTNTLSTVQKDNYICVAMRGRNSTNPSDRTPGIELEQTLELNNNDTSNCLTSVQKDNLVLENVMGIDEQNMNVRTETFGTLTKDGSSPKHNNRVMIKQATRQGYIECNVGGVADFSYPDSKTRRGRVQGNGEISPTITVENQDICKIETQYRIRKLTPKECWRLMDFSDEDFEKAKWYSKVEAKSLLLQHTNHKGKRQFTEMERIERMSNTQLYKQSGNSIVVNVLVAILGQLLPGKENVYKEINK